MMTRFLSFMKSAPVALLLFLMPFVQGHAAESFNQEQLTVTSQEGVVHKFTVELALTDGQRQQGLMFRRHMTDNAGMLFDFDESRRVTMWMKNTFIPLDMLFISEDGTVTSVQHNAVPQSEAVIDSGGLVRFVLELNAGIAKKLMLKPGSRVESEHIKRLN